MAVSGRVDFKGPFFERDPRKTFRANVRDLMQKVADEGEADVTAQLRAGQGPRAPLRGLSPDRVSGYVVGRTRSLAGKQWQVSAVVSVNPSGLPRTSAVKVMAAASLLEGRHHAFRRTTSAIRRSRKAVQANLLKGIG